VQIPGTTVPVQSVAGKTVETSPCFKTPLAQECQAKVTGCRSICKALDQGWIGFYIDTVQGDKSAVDPTISLPSGTTMRWSQQFLQVRRR
jgi:hypothetical protein